MAAIDLLPKLGGLDVAAIGPFLRAAVFQRISKYLVCIDDVERRGSELPMHDLLGIVAQLREQKSCKVIVLLNVDALPEADSEQYFKYGEKVFDHTITFSPSSASCANLVFDSAENWHAIAAECAQKLGITNIRVLARARDCASVLLSYLREPEELRIQIVRSTVLLTWAY